MTEAKQGALNALFTLLDKQPNLLSFAGQGTDRVHGQRAADFCIQFVETYSAWLEKQQQK